MSRRTTKQDVAQALMDAESKLLAGMARSTVSALTSNADVNFERVEDAFRTKRGGGLAGSLQSLHAQWIECLGSDDASALEMIVGCRGMARSISSLESSPLPKEVKELIVEEFQRNIDTIGGERWTELTTASDPTMRLLRCCFLQWIPVGVYYFEYSAIPRRNILLCPLRRKGGLLRFLAFRMKGLSPTIEMHLPAQPHGRFTEEQSNRSHRLVARVLARQPSIRGISGSSWYCDPEAVRISPHLSFVRELFEKNGGFLHRLGPTKNKQKKALLKSKTRRRLFEEGKYVPTDYARYWARDDVIRWARIGPDRSLGVQRGDCC